VNVINKLNVNIIGIDFIHWQKLTYNFISRQVKFASSNVNSIINLNNKNLPAMTSTIIKVKFKGLRDPSSTYMANICTAQTPMVSGMPSIISIDKNNTCNIVVENCPPCDIMLESVTF